MAINNFEPNVTFLANSTTKLVLQ